MELKEYLAIFQKNIKTFILTVFFFVLAGILFQLFRPLNYRANLLLNVTRTGVQETADYRFDGFYRLQADEKFSDTIVRWLGSQRITTDILNDSKITTSGMSAWRLSRFFKAKRVSSQTVEISYLAGSSRTAQDISSSIVKIINGEAQNLNQEQKEESWFKVVGGDPVIKENKFAWSYMIFFSLALGIFFGIWAVLIRHYLK